jgi:exodeoxyribonuclease V alpha subunit
MEVLKGTLERIVYVNEETGYTIARFSSPDFPFEQITVVGNLMSAYPGESLILKGWWVNNPKYGRQFKIIEYETVMPATVVGIKKYLGSGLIKGIGPIMASRIVNAFGLETIDVIENHPDRLFEVPGIGPKRVERIKRAWEEQKEIKNIMIFLQSHEVSTAYAVKIYKTYGDEAIKVVREDPYRLADDIYGIGFKTADKIARSVGIARDSISRVMAGVQYVLSQKADDGHAFLPMEDLVRWSVETLEVDEEKVKRAVDELAAKEQVFVEGEAVYLAPFYHSEVGIANRLARLLRTPGFTLNETAAQRAIDKVERRMGVKFAGNQREAIRRAVGEKALILTGGPGTGKTTTTVGMIELFEGAGLRVLLAAPTGRAAKKLSETTGREAKTIHRLLEFSPDVGFKRDYHNPLEADVVIVDEMSMVDLILMNNLLKAIPPEAKLIMVGDVDQLPAVGAGNVLRDLIDSGVVSTVRLTEIFRQAQQSMIVMNAHRINRGEMPLLKGPKDRDFFFIEEEDPEKAADLAVDLCCRRLPGYYGYDPIDDIQLLAPMKRGLCGVDRFNDLLQSTLNPSGETIPRAGRNFKLGDKVMQVRNNYEYEVFNGDIGRIARVDLVNQRVKVEYPEKSVDYDIADLSELVLAYAITTHKSQGSEYRAVVMPLLTQHYMMLQRNLLYTAVTRAKELVVIVGSKRAMRMAIRNDKVAKRYTGLSARLSESFRNGYELLDQGAHQLSLWDVS